MAASERSRPWRRVSGVVAQRLPPGGTGRNAAWLLGGQLLSLAATLIATPIQLDRMGAERYGIVVVGGEQTVEPTVTDEEESRALGVPLHSPAFRFERVTHSQEGEIVEFVESIYRGDRYRLITTLSIPPERRRVRSDGQDGRRVRAARARG